MKKIFTLLLAPVFLFPSSAAGQDSIRVGQQNAFPDTEVFRTIIQTASALQQRPHSNQRDPALYLLAAEIRTATTHLLEQWTQAGQPEISNEYLLTLRVNLQALEAVLRDTVRTPREVLQAVRDDLSLKMAYSGAEAGISLTRIESAGGDSFAQLPRLPGSVISFPTTVRVEVVTIRNGVEAKGYLIRTNPKLYGVTHSAMFPFSSASSPTDNDLPPGDYTMWVVTSSGAFLVAVPVTIGATGQKRQRIQLVIP